MATRASSCVPFWHRPDDGPAGTITYKSPPARMRAAMKAARTFTVSGHALSSWPPRTRQGQGNALFTGTPTATTAPFSVKSRNPQEVMTPRERGEQHESHDSRRSRHRVRRRHGGKQQIRCRSPQISSSSRPDGHPDGTMRATSSGQHCRLPFAVDPKTRLVKSRRSQVLLTSRSSVSRPWLVMTRRLRASKGPLWTANFDRPPTSPGPWRSRSCSS
jgi:hypothetical protein